MDDICANCRYWGQEGPEHEGLCRRNAPLLVFPLQKDEQAPFRMFPRTREDDWCGEYQKRPVSYATDGKPYWK